MNNDMSYSNIKKKLESGKVVILDGAIGGELEKVGAPMDKNLWAGKCSNDCPDLVLKVHEKYIEAGADVITTNTYALAPISMKQYGYKDNIASWNIKSVEIAKTAAKNSKSEIVVAGSISTYGSWYRLGQKALKKNFEEHLKILGDTGIDLIILEAMTSEVDTVKTLIDCSKKVNLPTWLSVSCAFDLETNKVMLGYQESIGNTKAEIYGDFDNAIKQFSSMHDGPILIAHSDIKIINDAIKIIKNNHRGFVGTYPNNGYFEKPHWKSIENFTHDHFLENVASMKAKRKSGMR